MFNLSNQQLPFDYSKPWYQPYVHDQLRINDSWYRPMNIMRHVCKEKTFEARRLRKSGDIYTVTERNGREVRVGKIRLKDKFIVNQKPDGTFDALYCMVECDGDKTTIPISIPHKDFIRHNILHYIPFFPHNEDCPDRYIVLAFFRELLDGDDTKFLQLPQHSGWQESKENKTSFASSEIVLPKLQKYYPVDILERKRIHTEKSFAESAEELAKVLPAHWKYKFLLSVRITSLLLYFYGLAGLTSDQIFIVEPKSESNAKSVIAIIKNKNFSPNVCPLIDTKTNLQRELNGINDGIALFRDTSYAEDRKKLDAGLNVLLHDLQNCTGNEVKSRHLTVILSDNPGNISSEYPAYFISLSDCPDIKNDNELHQAIGEFESALIRLLTNSEITENLVTNALNRTTYLTRTEANSNYWMSWRMLRTTVEILFEYRLITPDEQSEIIRFLKCNRYKGRDSEQCITNDFRHVLSNCINIGTISIANQKGVPYFDPNKAMVFLDDKHINILAETIDTRILPRMKTTRKRNKLLSALKFCGKLYSNNNYKRNLDVETAPGVTETVSVYSFPKDILTLKCMEKINSLAFAEYIIKDSEFPEGFIPMARINGCSGAAGVVITDSTDEAESMYISGQTRSGKTYFLVHQAVIRAETGKKVIIFDQTGAFSPDELKKHLPQEIVENYFSHWNIGKQGIPIDLLSLENCLSLPEKKNRLFSIFSVAARITGDIQGKVLKKRLSEISKAIDTGRIHSLCETLAFFDETDPEQSKLKDRLEEVFDDLEGLNTYKQNWGEFLNSQKKIVVLSTSADGIRKSSQLIDMMIAGLYEYKQYDRDPRYTVILDEIEDLCLEKDGPVSIILRKGAKHRLSMLLASQEFSVEKDSLGKIIGNCGTLVFFRPKTDNIADISKLTGVDKSTLASLEQGQLIYHGLCYSKYAGKNKTVTLIGWTYKHNK
ncbi:MAG: type IV secretory system conjugative DNA transfer family protein [Alistipes sp.]|nr:type IV secretory system conjugative DNA transfer family protein [Alistipes sp.]